MSDGEGDFAVVEAPPPINRCLLLIGSFVERVHRLRGEKALWSNTDDLEEEDSDSELDARQVRWPTSPAIEEAMAKLQRGEFEFTPDDGRGLVDVWKRKIPALHAAKEWCVLADEVQEIIEQAAASSEMTRHSILKEAAFSADNDSADVEDALAILSVLKELNSSPIYTSGLISVLEEARREQKAAERRTRMLERLEEGEYSAIMMRVDIASQAQEYERARAEWLELNSEPEPEEPEEEESATERGTEQFGTSASFAVHAASSTEFGTSASNAFSVQAASSTISSLSLNDHDSGTDSPFSPDDSDPDSPFAVSFMHSEGKGAVADSSVAHCLLFGCVFMWRCSDV